MIDIKAKQHDRYSMEFKVGFEGPHSEPEGEFAINTWLFLPGSLDINPSTYNKQQFQRDIKSNIRLITPEFSIDQLSDYDAPPYINLRDSVASLPVAESFLKQPHSEELVHFEFQVKLFAAIFKSALRDDTNRLLAQAAPRSIEEWVGRLRLTLRHFRELRPSLPKITAVLQPFDFADEYMSQLVELHGNRLLAGTPCESVKDIILEEREYKESRHYVHIDPKAQNNDNVVLRHSQLKKYIEGALYLKVETQRDGKAVEQFWLGIAAGVAMVISTLIALPFQHYWSNYPTLIFIILVVAYMLKDRIKEFMRSIFSNQLKNRYFDNKTTVKIKDRPIGWIKESMNFVNDSRVPDEVMRLRNRSDVEKANTQLGEQIIFYRKRVFVDSDLLRGQNRYDFSGIHDIMRVHLHHFVQKMDDPDTPLRSIDTDGNTVSCPAKRTYPIVIVMQLQTKGNPPSYQSFHLSATREGLV